MPVRTVEFTDTNGAKITIRADMIKHVARPKGGYAGEVELTTGAKWGFGGTERTLDYERVLAAFEEHDEDRRRG